MSSSATLHDRPNSGEGISNLKMQKLVYYAQGFHLAVHGERLFDEAIETWKYGPVVRSLYDTFKIYGDSLTPPPKQFDASIFTDNQHELLDEVYAVYGQFSAWKLRDMTHEEAPWKDVTESGSDLISDEALRQYFLTRLVS